MLKPKKTLLLLGIIYLAFISLGLPDGVLGVAWPAMRVELGLPLESVGILTTLLLFMSAFSSIMSGRTIAKWGTGSVTFFSGLMTGLALLGFSLSPSLLWLVLCTIPLGLGQGAVDSGLNLYVAEHYTSRQMNWLHCFWGVGAAMGPLLMTGALTAGSGWRTGYGTVSTIQLSLAAVLFASLASGLWKVRHTPVAQSGGADAVPIDPEAGLHSPTSQALAVLLFFLYAGVEFSMGVWINSVLVESRNIPIQLAGLTATAFYASIMAGRFLSGIVVNRLGNMRMIRLGLSFGIAGTLCAAFSASFAGVLFGVVLAGLGMAPTYPCLMHETPIRFRKSVSDRLIGWQVGAGCLGGSLVSSMTGVALSRFSLELLFPILTALLLFSLAANEILNRNCRRLDRKCA